MEDKRISEYDNLAAADIQDTDLLEIGRPSIKNFKLTWANLRLAVINFLSDILLGKEDVSNKKTNLTDNSDAFYVSQKAVKTAIDSVNTAIDSKQDKLVSGTNIKTINSNTLLGSGNIEIEVPEYFDDLSDIPAHPGVADKILNTKSSGYEWVDKPSVNFGGTGVDGALSISSGTTTLDLGGASIFVKNYTTIDITGTGQLAFSNPAPRGTIIILKATGNVTITSSADPAIDLRNLGGAGGSSNGAPGLGWHNSGGYQSFGEKGSSDNHGFGGGGGGNLNAGADGGIYTHGGINWAVRLTGGQMLPKLVSKTSYDIYPGGGGSSGMSCGDSYGTGYAGGRGAGALVIECGGALNFTGKINANGTNGSGPGTLGSQYGGGGGAGGSVLILYNTLTANTGTITVTGGAGGPSGTGLYPGAAGGAGSIGQSLVEAFYD